MAIRQPPSLGNRGTPPSLEGRTLAVRLVRTPTVHWLAAKFPALSFKLPRPILACLPPVRNPGRVVDYSFSWIEDAIPHRHRSRLHAPWSSTAANLPGSLPPWQSVSLLPGPPTRQLSGSRSSEYLAGWSSPSSPGGFVVVESFPRLSRGSPASSPGFPLAIRY